MKEINGSLQKLLIGKEKCDDNDTDDDADDADGQHEPYVSVMLRRRRKNMFINFYRDSLSKKVVSSILFANDITGCIEVT